MNKVEKSILNSIKKNGYPDKKVNLPFQTIFSACKKHGLKLSDVLKSLKEKGILSEIGNEKVLFYAKQEKKADDPTFDSSESNMFKAAMDKVKDMDPKTLNDLKQKVMNMSAEERAELMSKAKDFLKK